MEQLRPNLSVIKFKIPLHVKFILDHFTIYILIEYSITFF